MHVETDDQGAILIDEGDQEGSVPELLAEMERALGRV
jgi:hypothetical protein